MATHEQAILMNDCEQLNKAKGDLVSIAELEVHFANTSAAKVNDYICADPNCGVAVSAVVLKGENENGRKRPKSYFAARSESHRAGCTREPIPTEVPSTNESTEINAQDYLSEWVDPIVHSKAQSQSTSNAHTYATTDNGGANDSRKSKLNGSGIVPRKSQLIRRFAQEWLDMDVWERKKRLLKADWNEEETYFSAFIPLEYYVKKDIQEVGKKIFVGSIDQVIHGKTGFTVVLSNWHSSKFPIWVWVTNEALDLGTEGSTLRDKLETLKSVIEDKSQTEQQNWRVFGLGEIIKQTRSNHTWWSLRIEHPSNIALLVE